MLFFIIKQKLIMKFPLTLIADVHTKFDAYYAIVSNPKCVNSIQIGDFGFEKTNQKMLKSGLDFDKHKILFGNHDDYNYLFQPYSLENYRVFNLENSDGSNTRIMTIRGAKSIDKNMRFPGIDWFPQEELNIVEWYEIATVYENVKPHIVITHCCPQFIKEILFEQYNYDPIYKSITCDWLEELFNIHQPKLWVFGHHHKSVKFTTENGTRFKCLAELETFELTEDYNKE